MKKLAITVILGAALLAEAPCALAQTRAEAPRVVVRYGDLNLQSPAGREAFQRRLTAGAVAFCGAPPSQFDLGAQYHHQACVKDATERTLIALRRTDVRFADIAAPMLLAGR
jgi:UrcA family protein